jgi:epoxide hydrolase 4
MTKQRQIKAGDLTFNVVEAGPAEGALIILLHGFPEFWFEWREIVKPLAQSGFRVVAPDQRGYGLSEKPRGVDAYRLDWLADDVVAIARAFGHERFHLVGHDWGGSVAWWLATRRPEHVSKMVISNAAHPAVWRAAMKNDPEQRRRSGYVRIVRIPWIPEAMIRLGGYRSLEAAFAEVGPPGAFDRSTIDRYRVAWRQPGALTSMLNWYRALFRQPLPMPALSSIPVPTLLIWGDRDRFAVPGLADRSASLCRNVQIEHWPDATHWTPHDDPERFLNAVLKFVGEPRPS